MRVLVTGGAGFVGSHVIDRLRASHLDVLCIDKLDPQVHPSRPGYLRSDVTYHFTDVRNWQPDSTTNDIEAIVHFAALGGVRRAAREPAQLVDNNVGSTVHLVQAAQKLPRLRRFILMSSFSVYGSAYRFRIPSTGRLIEGHRRTDDLEAGRFGVYDADTGEEGVVEPITVSAPHQPMELYGASKAMQELCLAGFKHAEATILRASSIFGPRMRWEDEDATIIARLAGWAARREPPRFLEDGRQRRDWVSVHDVSEAILRLLAGSQMPVLNLCSGVPMSLVEACRALTDYLGIELEPEILGGFRPGDMRDCLGDAAPLTRLLGRPPVSLRAQAGVIFEGTPFERCAG